MTPTRETFGNIPPSSQLAFYLCSAVTTAVFCYGVWLRWRIWRIGAPTPPRSGATASLSELFGRVRGPIMRTLLEAGLQRRVRGHGWGSVAHICLYAGFMVLFAGTVMLEIDYLLSSVSPGMKFHQGAYYVVYETTLDLLGVLFLLGTVLFCLRRLRRPANLGHRSTDWYVLGSLLAIGVTGYLVESLRLCWQQPSGIAAQCSPVGLALRSMFDGLSEPDARRWHLGVWWMHSILVFGFIAAIPFTRLLHFIVGPLNLLLAPATLGTPPPVTIDEVEQTGRVGPTDIRHFSRQQLLSLDACMQCGRCDEVCPAFGTDKPLSPQRIVQNLTTVMETSAKAAGARHPDEAPALLGLAVAPEALWSCTTCTACVNICPVRIDHLAFILPLRRQLVAEGMLRGTAATALRRMQLHANPWGLPQTDRGKWNESRK